MASTWLFSSADKPPQDRKPATKRPPGRGAGQKGRTSAPKRRGDETKAPARHDARSYQSEIAALADSTARLPPDFRGPVIRLVRAAVQLFERAWRKLHGDAPEPAGSPADAPGSQEE